MSTASWRTRLAEGAGALAWLAALAIVAWSPFPGGPRVPSAVLGAMALLLLALHGRELTTRPATRRWLLIFALLWLPALASLPGSVHPYSTWKVVAVLALYAFTGLGVVAAVASGRARAALLTALAVVLGIWTVDSYVQYLAGRDLLGIPLSPDGRVVGMFEDNLRQSTILAALAPLLLWRVARVHPAWAALAWLAVLGVVLLTGVRGSWVMILLAGAAFLWHVRVRARALLPWLAAGTVVVVLAVLQSGLVERKLSQTTEAGELGFEAIDRALGRRLTVWDTALAMFLDRPVTGVGAGAFDEAYPDYARRPEDPFRPGGAHYQHPVYHAHHMWVSVTAESGLLGLGALLAAVILCGVWYRRAGEAGRAAARPCGVALLVVAFPVNSQPVLLTNWWLPVMILLTGLFLAGLDEDHVAPAVR